MPRKSSVYEVVYKDPEPAPNARSGGKLYATIEAVVRDNKESWAQIVECQSRSGANSILYLIKQGKTALPAPLENFKFTCRSDAEAGKSWLFALYSENGFPEEKAQPAKPARKRAAKAS